MIFNKEIILISSLFGALLFSAVGHAAKKHNNDVDFDSAVADIVAGSYDLTAYNKDGKRDDRFLSVVLNGQRT